MGSNPTGAFLTKFILFCVTLDLSENLTEMSIVKKGKFTMIQRAVTQFYFNFLVLLFSSLQSQVWFEHIFVLLLLRKLHQQNIQEMHICLGSQQWNYVKAFGQIIIPLFCRFNPLSWNKPLKSYPIYEKSSLHRPSYLPLCQRSKRNTFV